jgi:hypothetical protein
VIKSLLEPDSQGKSVYYCYLKLERISWHAMEKGESNDIIINQDK